MVNRSIATFVLGYIVGNWAVRPVVQIVRERIDDRRAIKKAMADIKEERERDGW